MPQSSEMTGQTLADTLILTKDCRANPSRNGVGNLCKAPRRLGPRTLPARDCRYTSARRGRVLRSRGVVGGNRLKMWEFQKIRAVISTLKQRNIQEMDFNFAETAMRHPGGPSGSWPLQESAAAPGRGVGPGRCLPGRGSGGDTELFYDIT